MYDEFDEHELTEQEQREEIFFNIIHRYIGLFSRTAQHQTSNDTASEYPFVAMDARQVFGQVSFVKDYLLERDGLHNAVERYSFIDVGCGMGNVMLIAEQLGFDVFGIEKDRYTLPIARQLFDESRVLEEDIRHYPDYHRFDVVYYFCPFSDGDLQRSFESQIEAAMKPAAILIANHKRSMAIDQDGRFKRLHPHYNIWEKIAS